MRRGGMWLEGEKGEEKGEEKGGWLVAVVVVVLVVVVVVVEGRGRGGKEGSQAAMML